MNVQIIREAGRAAIARLRNVTKQQPVTKSPPAYGDLLGDMAIPDRGPAPEVGKPDEFTDWLTNARRAGL